MQTQAKQENRISTKSTIFLNSSIIGIKSTVYHLNYDQFVPVCVEQLFLSPTQLGYIFLKIDMYINTYLYIKNKYNCNAIGYLLSRVHFLLLVL